MNNKKYCIMDFSFLSVIISPFQLYKLSIPWKIFKLQFYKKKSHKTNHISALRPIIVGVTRFELATSTSRTQRSTKLSHTPIQESDTYDVSDLSSYGQRTRTSTNRVRVCCAAITPIRITSCFVSVRRNIVIISTCIKKVNTFFIFFVFI